MSDQHQVALGVAIALLEINGYPVRKGKAGFWIVRGQCIASDEALIQLSEDVEDHSLRCASND